MRRVILIQPKRDGRVFGKAPGSPYTLMRLASLVPDEIPVEIWDDNLRELPMDTLGEGDLVGISSMTITIERAEHLAKIAHKQGAGVVVGGVHSTLLPEHVQTFAHSSFVGEGYYTWPQAIEDFATEGVKGLKPEYKDESWANLTGIAPITDRVIQMVDENKDFAVGLRESVETSKDKLELERSIREVEKLFPQVEQIIAGSEFGQDALKKATQVLEQGKAAATSMDSQELAGAKDSLMRTLNMFKGVVSKTGM